MGATGLLLELLAARIRRAGGRWWLVAAGIALCGVLPVLGAASATLTSQAALRQGLAALPAGERSVTVSYNGILDPAEAADADRQVRARLPQLTSAPVRRQLIYRPLADGSGGEFVLGAADGLPSAVRVTQGRLPRTCTPTRCEVVVLGTPPPAGPLAELGLVVVGTARRTDPLLLSGTFDPNGGGSGSTPLLLVDGVDRGTAIAAFSVFQRSYGWVAGLDLDRVGADGVADWVARSARVHDRLWLDREGLFLTSPDRVLRDEDARARASARRFAVLGSATALLLLGTAVAGGAAVRGDHQRFADALRRRGASPGRLAALTAAEVVVTVLAGLLVGLAGSAALAAVLAARADLPALATAGSAVLTALPVVLGLSVLAGLLVALVLVWPAASAAGERVAWRAVDAVALGCLAVAVLLAARGGVGVGVGTGGADGAADAGAGAAASTGTDPLLPTMPALALLGAALLLARAWPPLVRLSVQRLPRRAVAARLGLSAAGSRPLRPVVTAAVLTAAIAATVFAGGYRATLDRGAADQAAFQVPLDLRVRGGASLVPPLAADSLAGYRAAAGPGGGAFGVLHTAGSLRLSAAESAAVQLVGVDPDLLPRMASWSAVAGGDAPDDVRSRLAEVPAGALAGPGAAGGTAGTAGSGAGSEAGGRGLALPAGRTLVIRTPGDPVRLALTGWIRADDGRETGVPLAVTRLPDGAAALTGTLPAWTGQDGDPRAAARLRLVAVEAQQASDEVTQAQHGLAEGGTDRSRPTGRITLGAVAVDGRAVSATPWTGWAAGPGAAAGGTRLAVAATPSGAAAGAAGQPGAAAVLDYRLTTGSVVLGPASAIGTTDAPLPVAVDPVTARSAGGGLLTVLLDGVAVQARPVVTLDRFPQLSGRFVVADRQALAAVVDRTSPGASQPDEIWVATASATGGAAAAGGVPEPVTRQRLEVTARAALEHQLRTDPVARAAGSLLVAGALLALGVAAVILVLLVLAERRDDAAELYSWEADGVRPGTLRAALWWRAVAVAVPAVPAGALAGLALSGAVARLVAVTATAQVPQPPLQAATGLGWGSGAVAVGVLGALALAWLASSRALREPLPVRSRG